MRSYPHWKTFEELNPVIWGWSNYYRTVVSSDTFSACDRWSGSNCKVGPEEDMSEEEKKLDRRQILETGRRQGYLLYSSRSKTSAPQRHSNSKT